MPMVAKLAFIDRQTSNMVVVLGNSRRHFRLFAGFITNLMRLAHPTSFRLKPAQSIYIKMSTHKQILYNIFLSL